MTKALWNIAGIAFVALGIIGALLPVMPTTIFILLAAACFARGSERLHAWLVNHRQFGPLIRDWQQRGAIRRPAKRMALVAIGLSFILTAGLGVPGWVLAVEAVTLGAVSLFIVTRPEA